MESEHKSTANKDQAVGGQQQELVQPGLIPPNVNEITSKKSRSMPFTETKQPKHTLKGHNDSVLSVCFYGERVVSVSADSSMFLWDMDTGQHIQQSNLQNQLMTCAASEKLQRIATACDDGFIVLLDDHLEIKLERKLCDTIIKCLRFWGDAHAVCGTVDGRLCRTAIESEGSTQFIQPHMESINSIALCPRAEHLVLGSSDKTVSVIDMNLAVQMRFTGHTNVVYTAVWLSPTTIVSGGHDKVLRIWSADNGEQIAVHDIGDPIWCLDVAADFSLLAMALGVGLVSIWSLPDLVRVTTITAHTSPVNSVCLSPNEHFLASASEDQTVKLFEA